MPRHRLLLAACLGLAACSSPTPIGTPASTADLTEPSPAASGVPPRSSGGPTSSGTPNSGDPPALSLQLVAEGLADPISATGTPDGWLLVNERAGRVMAVNPANGQSVAVLDLTDRVQGGGEQGLLGFALHPDWPDVPRAFVHYSGRATEGDTVVSEVSGTSGTAGAPPTFDPASERVLLEVDQPFPNHNGGQLAFGPDGFLYVGLGDGGSANDPLNHGQDVSTLLGSILRLDVASAGSYAVPADNPFASGEGGAPEVFLYGLRNPWRFSFDRQTGLLWIADVGQNAYEEVNRIDPVTQSGANLGWNVMEAAHCFADEECETDGLTLPLAEYGRDLGCSVTGGYVYRGTAVPGLGGWYLLADYCTGRIFGVASDAQPPADGGALPSVTLLESGLGVSAFGEGADGELYVVDLAGGSLYRIVGGP